jgi:hypothetical protein
MYQPAPDLIVIRVISQTISHYFFQYQLFHLYIYFLFHDTI